MIKRTLKTLSRLPEDKIKEVSEFADEILKKLDEDVLQAGMEALMAESDAFYFLNEEEDLYSKDDLKEIY